MNLRYGWLLTAIVCMSGCGREERTEAVKFSRLLLQQQAVFTSVNALEKDFLTGTRAWCGAIATNGAARGVELGQNATTAQQLATSANTISTQLGPLRQAISAEALKMEYPQSVRSTLTEKLTKRQRFLQQVRTLLEDSAASFSELRQNREYKGDTYPGAIGKLNELLQAYQGPEDVLAEAITALRTKYNIKDADLGA